MKDICPYELCTGCMACLNICKFDAIKMVIDELGFKRPEVNNNCINCRQCEYICPQNKLPIFHFPQKAYAAYSLDAPKDVTSGGIASLIYQEAIESMQAITYGVIFNKETQRVEFCRKDANDYQSFAGSKYVQADINYTFQDIKRDIENDKYVVFIATPCQVGAAQKVLEKLLRKDINEIKNLLLVDIICHGCPSIKMLLDSILTKNQQIEKISFRAGNRYRLRVIMKNEEILVRSIDSLFFEGFHSGRSLRQCCHSCRYASLERVGDLTLGDFWGLGEDSLIKKEVNRGQGINLILENTKKGKHFLELILEKMKYEERSIQEAYEGNSQLRHPTKDSKYSEIFRNVYKKSTFETAIQKSRSIKEHIKHIPFIWKVIKMKRG